MNLTKGANAPVTAAKLRVVVSWSGTADVDIAALLCASTGKVRSDDDFVFYNQPRHTSGAVSHIGKTAGSISVDAVTVDLDRVEADIEKIVISASAYGGNFGQLAMLGVSVLNAQDGGE